MRPRNRDPHELELLAHGERATAKDRPGCCTPSPPLSSYLMLEVKGSFSKGHTAVCCPASRKEYSGENLVWLQIPSFPQIETYWPLSPICFLFFSSFLLLHRPPALEMKHTLKENRLQIASRSKGGSLPSDKLDPLVLPSLLLLLPVPSALVNLSFSSALAPTGYLSPNSPEWQNA